VLPVLALTAFVVMVAIGERQVRSSPNWPPPLRHEVGGWEIQNPSILDWAAGLNFPATIPILFAWVHNDAFSNAFDDHRVVIYLPWVVLVYFLWRFVGYRLDRPTGRTVSHSQIYIVLAGQVFLTLELLYSAIGMSGGQATNREFVVVACFSIWLLLAIIGWADFIRMLGRRGSTGQPKSEY
jgi:hypothetical protein